VRAGNVVLGLGTCMVDVVACWAGWACASSSACPVVVGMPCWVENPSVRLCLVCCMFDIRSVIVMFLY
jgi:hypothetical protein